jgi:hypothetical protein
MHDPKLLVATLVAGLSMSLSPAAFASPPAKSHAAAKKAPAKHAAAKKDTEPDEVTETTVPPPSGSWEPKPPSNSPGWVWSAGYFQWKDGRYQWKAGEWVADKPGMDYRQHAWVQKGDKWVLTGGDWVPETQASTSHESNSH